MNHNSFDFDLSSLFFLAFGILIINVVFKKKSNIYMFIFSIFWGGRLSQIILINAFFKKKEKNKKKFKKTKIFEILFVERYSKFTTILKF